MQMGKFSKGDLVIIPQKVTAYNVSVGDVWSYNDIKTFEKPTIGLFMETVEDNPIYSAVIVESALWYVRTEDISKGESYAGKTNRSL